MTYHIEKSNTEFKITCLGKMYTDVPNGKVVRIDTDDYDNLVHIILGEFNTQQLLKSNNRIIIKCSDDEMSFAFYAGGPKGKKFIKHLEKEGLI